MTVTLKIRLLHWLMVFFIVINLFIFDDGDTIHVWVGYGSLLIILPRLFLGLTGSGHAAPNRIAFFAYVVFWGLVIGLGVSGILLVHFEDFFGAQNIENAHDLMAKAVIVFIIVHFSGIIIDSILHHRKTWMAMISGKKSV